MFGGHGVLWPAVVHVRARVLHAAAQGRSCGVRLQLADHALHRDLPGRLRGNASWTFLAVEFAENPGVVFVKDPETGEVVVTAIIINTIYWCLWLLMYAVGRKYLQTADSLAELSRSFDVEKAQLGQGGGQAGAALDLIHQK